MWISSSQVTFDDDCWEGNEDPTANNNGLPPSVNLPLRIRDIKIRLVHSKSNAGLVVGYRLLYESLRTHADRDVWKMVVTMHFYYPVDFGMLSGTYVYVECLQTANQLPPSDRRKTSHYIGR